MLTTNKELKTNKKPRTVYKNEELEMQMGNPNSKPNVKSPEMLTLNFDGQKGQVYELVSDIGSPKKTLTLNFDGQKGQVYELVSDTVSSEKTLILDEQTGQVYELIPETPKDTTYAWISGGYLLGAMLITCWLLFDTWIGQNTLPRLLGYDLTRLGTPIYRVLAYMTLGGALGGIVNGIRSILFWHSEKNSFGHRFLWKYLSLPWLGAIFAFFLYALLRGGIAVLGGSSTAETIGPTQLFTSTAIGVLAGYSSYKFAQWLDVVASRLFDQLSTPYAVVPDLVGKTKDDAELRLRELRLSLGAITEEVRTDEKEIGRVVKQSPAAGSRIGTDVPVNITLGTSNSKTEKIAEADKKAEAEKKEK